MDGSTQGLRIGHGYDVHRLVPGRPLILGGVEIPWEKGLLGHSDADVLTHAVMDALCGASKLGDIGKLFPDTDPRYAGISSLELLRQVASLLAEGGWTVVNIDATLLAQAPKVGPFRREMESKLAAALKIPPQRRGWASPETAAAWRHMPWPCWKSCDESGEDAPAARPPLPAHPPPLFPYNG